MRAYRIHCADEPLETLLNPRRPDGWASSDESTDTQPFGVSACRTIGDLMAYAREYSMAALPGSRLVELDCTLSPERDRDNRAVRVIVRSYRVIGSGERLIQAAHNRNVRPGRRA